MSYDYSKYGKGRPMGRIEIFIDRHADKWVVVLFVLWLVLQFYIALAPSRGEYPPSIEVPYYMLDPEMLD